MSAEIPPKIPNDAAIEQKSGLRIVRRSWLFGLLVCTLEFSPLILIFIDSSAMLRKDHDNFENSGDQVRID